MVHAVLRPCFTQLEHASSSFADTLPQFEHASSSFEGLGARCTQFWRTLHADEVRYTQLFVGPERRAASSTCAFDGLRSFWGVRNCVRRTPSACSVGRNCVRRTPSACSVGRNCVRHTPTACTVRRRFAPGPRDRRFPFFAYPASKPRIRPASAELQLSGLNQIRPRPGLPQPQAPCPVGRRVCPKAGPPAHPTGCVIRATACAL